jgi:hypothetical protein
MKNLGAIRRWKRDGSLNHLSREAAVQNLAYNTPNSIEHIQLVLAHGGTMHTPHAAFTFNRICEEPHAY